MNYNDVKIGMKVVPHSKHGSSLTLKNSIVYNNMIAHNQKYLYVIDINFQDKHIYAKCNTIILSNINNRNKGGDFYIASDFELYQPVYRKEKILKIKEKINENKKGITLCNNQM